MDTYRHGLETDMVKWAQSHALQLREEREINLRANLDLIYEGYYPEDD